MPSKDKGHSNTGVKRKKKWLKFAAISLVTLTIICALFCGAIAYMFYHFGRDLPDHQQLARYEPPIMTRVHAANGKLLAEYAREERVFVPLKAMPENIKNAFLAAEDKNFYEHFGLDPVSVLAAVIKNIDSLANEKKLIGASTITQQVAKNFLLTNETSFSRKFKEAILAIRIEKAFSKDRILELYLNEIYLGMRSYGVAAASLNYFDKSLSELSLSESAYLAALPKGPNNYHPLKKKKAAILRRNWVLDRMVENGFIGHEIGKKAKLDKLIIKEKTSSSIISAEYFSEEVRRRLIEKFGENNLYEQGLSVRTTLDPNLQKLAQQVLRKGLIDYDRRVGWRGPLNKSKNIKSIFESFDDISGNPYPLDWKIAIVSKVYQNEVHLKFANGSLGKLLDTEIKWIQSSKIKSDKNLKIPLEPGDVLLTEKSDNQSDYYYLRQPIEVEGAIIAIDPHSGRILAMQGGFDYNRSQFNRATQARRQPGSAFKPFVYLAALENGLTPSTVILDAPVVIDQGPNLPKWKPRNYSNRFYGPSTLRIGLEKSQNLMTVRIAQKLGSETISDYAKKFGINLSLPLLPSSALGSGATTLLNLTSAYAMLVNGGKKILPHMIEKIQDRNGSTIYRHDQRSCSECQIYSSNISEIPRPKDIRKQIADPLSSYQIVSMLEGVVKNGTGRVIKSIGYPLAGKTGTTNDFKDAWFIGFSPDLAVGIFVGYDRPKSLGKKESGGRVAAPIFKEFMKGAITKKPAIPFRVPPGIQFVRVDKHTGLRPSESTTDIIVEAFKQSKAPDEKQKTFRETGNNIDLKRPINRDGLGGLY